MNKENLRNIFKRAIAQSGKLEVRENPRTSHKYEIKMRLEMINSSEWQPCVDEVFLFAKEFNESELLTLKK